MMTKKPKSITSDQTDRVADLARQATKTAIKKANPESVIVQTGIIEQPGEFKKRVEEAIFEIFLEMTTSNKYEDEVTSSSYTYPKEYTGPKPIEEQVKTIAKIFDLDPKDALEYAKNLSELPVGAEGWFAIPKVSLVAKKHFSAVTDPAQQYCEAVKLVHEKIKATRSFYNYREGEIVPAKLRQHIRTQSALEQLMEQQSGDILIVAAQYGMRHRGKSVRRARETFAGNEFGLGSFALGCMALVHPERYVQWKQLHTDCAGDEFAPDADGDFSECPYLYWDGGGVRFGTSDVSDVHEVYGSASGFVPAVS